MILDYSRKYKCTYFYILMYDLRRLNKKITFKFNKRNSDRVYFFLGRLALSI